jgi:hypothetical protein
MRKQCLGLLALVFGFAGAGAWGQDISLGGARAEAHKGHVVLVSDAVQVVAGKPEVVELRFRVDQGFHINSHTPKDDLLIPTVVVSRFRASLISRERRFGWGLDRVRKRWMFTRVSFA